MLHIMFKETCKGATYSPKISSPMDVTPNFLLMIGNEFIKKVKCSGKTGCGVTVECPTQKIWIMLSRAAYRALNSHANFAPGATAKGAILRISKFDIDGNIKEFNGCKIKQVVSLE